MGNTYYMDYDAFGNVKTVTDCKGEIVTGNYYDDYYRLKETYDAEGGRTYYTYDQMGRLQSMAEAVGGVAGTGINGTAAGTATATGTAVTSYFYENGRMNKVIDPEKGESSYRYDARGNIQTVTDPMGNVTTYSYDSMNRVKTVTNALNQRISYTYNAEGLLEEETNARGQKCTYTYDALGRMTV